MRLAVIAAMACSVIGLSFAQESQAVVRKFTNIPAQGLGPALQTLANDRNLQLVYVAEEVSGIRTDGVVGNLTLDEALSKLLKSTALAYRYIDEKTITVEPGPAAAVVGPGPSALPQGARIQSRSTAQDTPALPSEDKKKGEAQSQRNEKAQEPSFPVAKGESEPDLETVVVTGTHIRGTAPVGSPVQVIHREEIDRAGFVTVQQLVDSLPQNFGGDAGAELIGTANSTNVSGGTGVNLRGLGSGATLILLNGRRMTQASGLIGDYVDISSIPLTAIERVEVLTDGASAIYGSDAIAGVVNFILRRDYEGAETRLRVSSDTSAGPEQYQFGQTFGKSWGSGSMLFAYEYFDSGALDAADRFYTANSDRRPYGGDDFRRTYSNPGTIVFPVPAAIPRGQDGSNLSADDLLLGEANYMEANLGYQLIRSEERHNAFLTVRHRPSERFELYGDFLFGQRDYKQDAGGIEADLFVPNNHPNFISPDPSAPFVIIQYNFIDDLGTLKRPGEVTNYNSAIGGTLDFAESWQLDTYASFSREDNVRFDRGIDFAKLSEALGNDDPTTPFDPNVDGYFNPFGDGSNSSQNVLDYIYSGGNTFKSQGESRSINAKVDGRVLDLPGGRVRVAFGGQYREELYAKDVFLLVNDTKTPAPGNSADEKRDVTSVFGEVVVPVVGSSNGRPGLRRLELSAALRYEDYSDFGSTSDPKFGLVWSPIDSISLRASWGTSFKAPDLQNLVPSGQFYFVTDYPNPNVPAGFSTVFFLTGSNPELEPETSTAKTFGIDFVPSALPEFKASLTYFDILFEKRIGTIPGLALSNLELFAPILTFNPDPALIQSLFDSPHFFGDFGSGGPIEVIIDDRLRNLAVSDVSGFDLLFSYDLATSSGEWEFGLNANYIRKFDEAVTATAPFFEVVNIVNRPVDLRLRATTSWTNSRYGAYLFVNHTDDYQDTNSTPARVVDDWTTVDLTLRYNILGTGTGSWLNDSVVTLSAQNLFNDQPPLINDPLGYDPANATATGRIVSLNFKKAW